MKAIVSEVHRFASVRDDSYKTAECDVCGKQEHERGTFEHVAEHFRREGWAIAAGGSSVVCPKCLEGRPHD